MSALLNLIYILAGLDPAERQKMHERREHNKRVKRIRRRYGMW